jgi:exodeoxyribonuclease V gamma subunit
VHSCHSPLREVEVLYDHLLEWFQHDRNLQPRDVLVMTPDIETYAPFIQAVFDAPEDASKRLPFSVADRGMSGASPVITAFFNLLRLPATRLEATAVLRLLETDVVRAKFGLAESDLDVLRVWVRDTNIRWGQDASQRESLGLPGLAENSWQQGMDRLFLGYAMAGGGERMFKDVLPYDNVEGSAADALGRFAEYVQRLFAMVAELKASRSVGQWESVLLRVLDRFFEPPESQVQELLVIRSTLRDLAAQAAEAGYTEPVELAVILECLTQLLEEDRFGAGFLTGGVTFCALKPMRSIPFKVICLIGMNDNAFPRTDRHLAFDLMARHPRLGDRSLRADDRYLFLETLLSARERLHISYVGQSIRDNSEAPPSVLVSELLDYVAQAYEMPGANLLKDHVIVRHRLQAFSAAYFNGTDRRLFSYSAENCRASLSRQGSRARPVAFLDAPLAEPEAEWRTVAVADLADFFSNPSKFLLTRRLKLRLDRRDEALEDVEPFGVDALDAYHMKQELTALGLKGVPLQAGLQIMKAAGRLPLGEAGQVSFRDVQADVQAFLERVRPRLGAGYLEPVPVDQAVGAFRLTGQLARLTANGSLHYRCASVKGKDLVRFWVQHLVLSMVQPPGHSRESVLVSQDQVLSCPALPEASGLAGQLLELYWRGLRQPLKFFPQTSWAYAQAVRKRESGDSRGDPMNAAARAWDGGFQPGQRAEGTDSYFNLCFRNESPLDEEFQQVARAVFDPLLAVMQEVEV